MNNHYIDLHFFNVVKDKRCALACFGHTFSTGSVILAILGISTVCSMAMLTTMLTIKSINRIVAIESQQVNTMQSLYEKHDQTLSDYLHNPINNDSISSTPITVEGIDYTHYSYPIDARVITSPPPGYSLNSNYSTQHIQIKSRIANGSIQTPVVATGLSCLHTRPEPLTDLVLNHYRIDDYFITPASYHLNSDTGMIWKNTDTGPNLLVDLGFTAIDDFGRADFAVISNDHHSKLLIAFAVTQSQNKKTDATNTLYIVFDELIVNETPLTQIKTQDLIALTTDYVVTGNEKGYRLPLRSGQLHVSAMTTISNHVVFVTQMPDTDQRSGTLVYENLLYQINLSATQGPLLNIKKLPDTAFIISLATDQSDLRQISLQAQNGLRLINMDINCRRTYQYEY